MFIILLILANCRYKSRFVCYITKLLFGFSSLGYCGLYANSSYHITLKFRIKEILNFTSASYEAGKRRIPMLRYHKQVMEIKTLCCSGTQTILYQSLIYFMIYHIIMFLLNLQISVVNNFCLMHILTFFKGQLTQYTITFRLL